MLCYLLQSGTIQKAKNMPTHPHTHIYTYTPSTKETCHVLMGRVMLSKSLIQLSVNGWAVRLALS